MKALFNEFRASDISAGILSGLMMVVIATACTALVFKNTLTPYFSIGISCALISSCLINFIIAATSAFPFAIARVEPAPSAILAIIFANIAAMQLPEMTLLPTLLATLMLTTGMVGVAMFLLGYFHLGNIVRFLPYPVLGGVITGTAWLMAKASLLLMTNNVVSIPLLTQTHSLEQLLPGIGFAVFLLIFLPKNHWRQWILLGSLFMIIIAVNLLLLIHHVSYTQAIQSGWMLSSFKPQFVIHEIDSSLLHRIDWAVIFSQFGYLLSFVGIIIIISLLNVSSLETLSKEKADLDHELKITGAGNLLGSLLCGTSANLSFSGTLLNKNIGAHGRISGMLASLVCLFFLIIYPAAVSYLPKPIIGGFLLFIALELLMDWLYTGWKKLPVVDYLIVLCILLIIGIWGFMTGVVVGILITCAVFIFRFTHIETVKFSATGQSLRSNVIRPIYQQKWLTEQGEKIQIFKLHGYLFFGSSKLLVDKINQLIEKNQDQNQCYLILDFQLVNGADSSASFSFIRLEKLIADSTLQLIFTSCSPALQAQLKQQGVLDSSSKLIIFPDLDQGLEWCEESLLKKMPDNIKPQDISLSSTLDALIPERNLQELFLPFLIRKEIPMHHYLFKQDEAVDCLYFIDSGEVSVFLEGDQTALRVSKSGAGTIVGEIGFYLHQKRSASVFTESNCVVYQLTEDAMTKLEKSYPEIALIFHKNIVKTLAMRIIQTNYELQVVSH